MPTSDPLHQDNPPVQCGHLNMFTGSVLGFEIRDTEADAKLKAEEIAKAKAQDSLDLDIAKTCPNGCTDEGAGGNSDAQAKEALQFFVEDVDEGKFVGFAESHWNCTRECAGTSTEKALTLPNPANRALTYNEQAQPECGKTRVYAGGVIACAQDAKQNDARKFAREGAVAKANELVRLCQGRKCPGACKPETVVGREVTLNDAKTILTKRIPQATGQPYVSHAVVYWTVSVACPAAGGGGGGGGVYEDERRDDRR